MKKDGFPSDMGEHPAQGGEALPEVDPDLLGIDDSGNQGPDEYATLAKAQKRRRKRRGKRKRSKAKASVVQESDETLEQPEIDDESVYFVSKITLKGYLEDLEHSTGEQMAPSALGSVWRVLAVFAKSVDGVHFEPPDARSPKEIERIDLLTLSRALGGSSLSLADRPDNPFEELAKQYVETEASALTDSE